MEIKHTEKYLLAYLDLLGVKECIESDTDDIFLNILSASLKGFENSLKKFMPLSGIEDCKFKVFSDNIIIAIPCNPMENNHHPVIALNRVQTAVQWLQSNFLECGFLTRGGVVYGSLYVDDMFVWGKALIDAYNLESKVARYPRVVIDQSVLELKKLFYCEDPSFDFLLSMKIREDFDGIFFFDYLNFPKDKDIKVLVNNSFEDILQRIEAEEDEKILEKYYWHRDYLLFCINERDKD